MIFSMKIKKVIVNVVFYSIIILLIVGIIIFIKGIVDENITRLNGNVIDGEILDLYMGKELVAPKVIKILPHVYFKYKVNNKEYTNTQIITSKTYNYYYKINKIKIIYNSKNPEISFIYNEINLNKDYLFFNIYLCIFLIFLITFLKLFDDYKKSKLLKRKELIKVGYYKDFEKYINELIKANDINLFLIITIINTTKFFQLKYNKRDKIEIDYPLITVRQKSNKHKIIDFIKNNNLNYYIDYTTYGKELIVININIKKHNTFQIIKNLFEKIYITNLKTKFCFEFNNKIK
jgi:hypothetical protein